MLILLSPAKTMTGNSKINAPKGTMPRFQNEANEIALQMAQLTVEELKKQLKLSPKLAIECYQRFHDFHAINTPALQALLAYTGVVFKHIKPNDFTEKDFFFAQEKIRFVSGCYGLLRPLDLIKPYRMEFDLKLPEWNDSNIYSFWRDKLTKILIDDTHQNDGILFNLASMDVRPAFHWKEIENNLRIITPEFKVMKNGKLETIVIYAKMCRGEMCRHIIKEQISNPEDLKNFTWEGFAFREALSSNNQWIFTQE